MLEFKENFDAIFRLECRLLGPIEIKEDGSIRLNCSRLIVYGDHPLYEKFGSPIINKKIIFTFSSVKFCSEMKIIPCKHEEPLDMVLTIPPLISSTVQNHSNSTNKYVMSEFLISNPCADIEKAWILEGHIEAASFSLVIE
jgi:hypothetical protein